MKISKFILVIKIKYYRMCFTNLVLGKTLPGLSYRQSYDYITQKLDFYEKQLEEAE